ncbi:AAA family ATPase [Pseudoalteromonas sp.]|uniref:AAA family ATPase n=1 Tax=Pseudoalteromonas sp. TaxID=53249 RepID=UPI0035621D78
MQPQILPSRAALVDRIALQFEYGQNLIVVLGTSGLGKSYLLETFITDKYNDFNKALVQVSAQMSDVQLMTELLEQSFNAPLIDHNLTLAENFYQLFQQQPCGPCLWVLDGGRHLSTEFLHELELLAKNSPGTLYIMLAAQSKLPLSAAVNIHLEPLSLAESKQLMRGYFSTLPYDEDPVFQAFLTAAQGNPSLLLSWQPNEHVADTTAKDTVTWRVQLVVLLLLIMLLIIGLLYKSDMTQWWQQYYQQQQQNVLTTAIPVTQLTSDALPPQMSLQTQQNEAQAITQADTAQALPQQDIAAIMQSLTVTAVPQPSDSAMPAPPHVLDDAIPSDRENKATAATPHLQGNAWYLQQPENNMVIQLLAISQPQIKDEFISQHQLQTLAHSYQTIRNNNTWWVVTIGSFANINEAKLAMQSLPPEVKKNKPFYKKISKIKQEIALVDQ